jgi:spore maturation protein CgeB
VRIAVLDTYYPVFLAEHYGARPELTAASYEEQLDALLGRYFGTQDAYTYNLRASGHEAINLITNCEQLQLAWARERGKLQLVSTWLHATPVARARHLLKMLFLERVVRAQIAAFDPDVVFVHDLWSIRRRQLDAWRAEERLVVGQIASPAPPPERLQGFDLILTSFPHFVKRFRDLGVDGEYFKLAFDERINGVLGEAASPWSLARSGAVFIGGVSPRVHSRGTALLDEVCRRFDVDVYGYAGDELPADSAIRRRLHGPVWGLEMYRVLAGAKVAINRHIDVAEQHSNNMRLYETTGVGTMLVTEGFGNLGDHFDRDREVVPYSDVDDLIQRVHYYLEHDAERAAIAAAGQQRTLHKHTYRHRMEELALILEPRLKR